MLKGIGVSKGIGRAPALCYVPCTAEIPAGPAADRAAEAAALRRAVDAAIDENQGLYQAALKRAGETEADIFAAHNMILEDEDSFFLPAQELIADEGVNAAAAAARVLDEIAGMMVTVEDAHLRERAADFRDVRDQVIRHILGLHSVDLSALEKNVILVAVDLSPSDTIRMDVAHIEGIICQEGGKTSHTAILAKAMGIPAIMGCARVLDQVSDGEIVLMDGVSGEVVCAPDEACCREFERRAAELETLRQQQEQYRGRASVTVDGHRVKVCANIASPLECSAAVEQDCEGVGLFRSEFLFMDRDTLPDEEEQYEVYRKTLELAAGRAVTFRTLDAGGDKKLPLLTEHEENPFLGYRAIRICLAEPDMFKTQLRALYRASAYGRLRIMFPMISSIEELREAKQIAAQIRAELKAEGVPFDEKVPVGIMVEIPSTAVAADLFARECDFFSIGTNDLVQYTVAVDRGNKKIERLYTHYHPAVLRLIQNTIRAAHNARIHCCMCGEAA
ncbi:MAG: phosphoenolpyruvate--protein phosphotransferase, partial [Lawsonibacter sp.]|nr:phosphoenolpyruvate--protein phosphotransferase [Lawsonibacter sp.]